MSADLIVFAGLAVLAVGLVTLAIWHGLKRNPVIYFATDALYWMAAIEILMPVARMTLVF